MLRFPLPLLPGTEWEWEGEEYSDGEKYNVNITGKVLGTEFVNNKCGNIRSNKIGNYWLKVLPTPKNRVTEWYTQDIGLNKSKE